MLQTILSKLAAKERNIAQKGTFQLNMKEIKDQQIQKSFLERINDFKLKLHKYIAISKCDSINRWESEDTESVPHTATNLLFGLGHNASLL